MKCDQKFNSDLCGMRLEFSGNSFGKGLWSQVIQAAPGKGTVTTFYLSNNGGMFSYTNPWNEIDFEIFGATASDGGSQVWTNIFTGFKDEHPQVITVPFNTLGFHTYTIKVDRYIVQWIVDGRVYRTFNVAGHGDLQYTVDNYKFRPYLSLWGSTWADPKFEVSQFSNMQGKLNDNPNPFPVLAKFKTYWNPQVQWV